MTKPPEVRLNYEGTLDEVVAFGAFFHLEQMSATGWWLAVEVGGERVDVWLNSTRRITTHFTVDRNRAGTNP